MYHVIPVLNDRDVTGPHSWLNVITDSSRWTLCNMTRPSCKPTPTISSAVDCTRDNTGEFQPEYTYIN